MAEKCVVCRRVIAENARLVLVRGKVHEVYCSEACLRANVRERRRAEAESLRRWVMAWAVVAFLPAGENLVWQHFHAERPIVIIAQSPGPAPTVKPPGPPQYGPAWPPTDADWMAAFMETSWVYPLPGPIRRVPKADGRIFGPDAPAHRPAGCREKDQCGVDLGGELWGEHVYAVHDGIVDRVQSGGNDERGGEYVRISHFGGMVFTQYFHLAGMPRQIVRGVHVKAGDVIGLLGDSGIKGGRRHLHFTLSVRPSPDFSEVYWDPKPWMADWPLHTPTHGTVAGYAPPTAKDAKDAKGSRRRRVD